MLIDEARTPLIISSENEVSNDGLELYYLSREVVKDLEVGDIIEDKNAPITSKTNIEKVILN